MRVAALYDIHGNLPALERVVEDVRDARVDQVVIGGDVIPGPMPVEALERVRNLGLPTHWLHGNGELAVLAQLSADSEGEVGYWGTTSGQRPPQSVANILRWTARQLQPELRSELTRWPKTVRFDIDGLGTVLFCHGTPRSEVDVFTRRTTADKLLPLIEPLGVDVVVCGHTHMQFDRMVGRTRVVNAGSVGAPFGAPGAYWLLLGPTIELRRTAYDPDLAAARIRTTTYPEAAEFVERSVTAPMSEATMLDAFAAMELNP